MSNRLYIVKDGVVQSGYTLEYAAVGNAPSYDQNQKCLNSHGNRAFGFANVNVANYNWVQIKATHVNQHYGGLANPIYDVTAYQGAAVTTVNTTGTLDVRNMSTANISWKQGTSGEDAGICLYDLWLEK